MVFAPQSGGELTPKVIKKAGQIQQGVCPRAKYIAFNGKCVCKANTGTRTRNRAITENE